MNERLRNQAKIQDYAVIGDCRSAALVSREGSIDWLCWPRFDSPAIFAALLDHARGGHWSIGPAVPFRSEHRYVEESNVLETTFHTASGTLRLTDVMPVASEEFKRGNLLPAHELIREVECTSGEVPVEVEFCPRPHYGAEAAVLRERRNLGICAEVGPGVYWLCGSTQLEASQECARVHRIMRAGDTLWFSLTYSEEAPAVLPPLGLWTRQSIARSVAWWNRWAGECSYEGPYRDSVVRSALALKLLAYAPSGAITAAATTSLPERLGADLNWDYRYCWLRDAAFTIRALLGIGFRQEADAFLDWMLHATRLTQPELKILYTLHGQMSPKERELPHLSGYFGSRPVRVGNEARDQLQLDVYGEVIDGAAQCAAFGSRFDGLTQKVLTGFGKYVVQYWDQPDEGIWEPRSGRQHHTHSRLLCWTALDRLLMLSKRGFLEGAPADLFERERDRIARQIYEQAWNPRLGSYVSTLDGDELDATLLLLPWYGFEKADSARMKSTYQRVREQLGAANGLLYRYRHDPPEGAFGICSFWGAEYLALGGGTLEEAHAVFRQLLAYKNDLGLYAEQTDPESGDALGNFPQAFTHIGLISAALALEERERGEQPVSQRADQAAPLPGREADLVGRLRHRIAELEQLIEVEQKRTHEHLQLAADVHRSLLPSPVRTDRAEVDVRYQPVDGVGGDYCQMHFPSENVWYITMCDVTGHGVAAALLATRVSSEVRTLCALGKSPVEVVDGLNRFVCRNFGSAGLFLTFFAARIDLPGLEVTWSGAGHPSPILVRADGGTIVRLASQNLIIGVLPECLAAEPEHRTRLEPGDRILFYTDGVTEVFDATGAELGEEGLARLVLDAMPAGVPGMIDRILQQVVAFQHGPTTDDRTLILFGAR